MAVVESGRFVLSTTPVAVGVTDKPYMLLRAETHPDRLLPFGSVVEVWHQDNLFGIQAPIHRYTIWGNLSGSELGFTTTINLSLVSSYRRRVWLISPNVVDLALTVFFSDSADLSIPVSS